MTTSTDNRKAFIDFLSEIASGTYKADTWEQFVATHYSDLALESARVEFMQTSIAAGDWLPASVPGSLRNKAMELRSQLLSDLTPQEIEILRDKFGIDMLREYSPEEVSRQFQITRDKLREIESKISNRPPDGDPPDAA